MVYDAGASLPAFPRWSVGTIRGGRCGAVRWCDRVCTIKVSAAVIRQRLRVKVLYDAGASLTAFPRWSVGTIRGGAMRCLFVGVIGCLYYKK